MTQASLNLQTLHSQNMSPRLQQAVRLLQLSSMDYELELRTMATKNPFLEIEEQNSAPHPVASDAAVIVPTPEPPLPDTAMPSTQAGSSDAHTAALESTAADIELRPLLRSQANVLPLSARDHVLVCTIIESLDDDGYLREELEDLAVLADLEPAADACEMKTALKLVQSFEPLGVGARSVSECLLLQIQNVDSSLADLMRYIATDYLELLARRDMRGLAQQLQCTVEEVAAACDALRRLDPRPGWCYGKSEVHFLRPDVVASKVNGAWTVQLNPAVVPAIKLNQTYADMYQQHRENKKHAALGAELQEARWAVRNVSLRFSTILSMAQAIAQRQALYLEHGPLGMKPLALSDIAQAIGVHESTVCRVSHNKYMSVDGRLIELKQFFSRSMPMADNKVYSSTQIRALVQEMVAEENPHDPLSDVEIAKRLARQGLTVARRTVTKYRQLLGIPPIEQRRQTTQIAAVR